MDLLRDGDKIGDCVALAHLGSGLTGEVYRGRYVRDGTMVALKVFDRKHENDPTVRGYFLNEQMLIREVTKHRQHPNIVAYVTSQEAPPHIYLATRYIQGATTLEKLIIQPLSASFALHVVESLASALDYLHYGHPDYSPIIHRDVKPNNVLIGPSNEVFVIDFSIARLPIYSPPKERGLGTVSYMPPEQYEGRETPATDQFALAVIALQMLTAHKLLPEEKHASREKLAALRDELYKEVREVLGARVHTAEVLIRALQYVPEDRYATCEEFAFELRQALIADREALGELRVPPRLPRMYVEIGVVALIVLIAVAFLMLYLR
jgi:eukaryotic-like serine/threonine-protein kinase